MKHSQADEQAKREKRTACAVCFAAGTLTGALVMLAAIILAVLA